MDSDKCTFYIITLERTRANSQDCLQKIVAQFVVCACICITSGHISYDNRHNIHQSYLFPYRKSKHMGKDNFDESDHEFIVLFPVVATLETHYSNCHQIKQLLTHVETFFPSKLMYTISQICSRPRQVKTFSGE